MRNFTVIYKFNMQKFYKNKFNIISCLIIFVFILLINLIMFFNYSSAYVPILSIVLSAILASIFLTIYNVNNITRAIISDKHGGVESIQSRRGVKDPAIFFSKFLAIKTVTWVFIMLVYLSYIAMLGMFQPLNAHYVLTTLSVGLLALFPFDFILTGMTYLLAAWTYSNKKTIPVVWIFTTLMSVFFIFGPLPVMVMGLTNNDSVVNAARILKMQELAKEYPDGISAKLLDGNESPAYTSDSGRENPTFYSTQNVYNFVRNFRYSVPSEDEENGWSSQDDYDFSSYFAWVLTNGGLMLEFSENLSTTGEFVNIMKTIYGPNFRIALSEGSTTGEIFRNNFITDFVRAIANEAKASEKLTNHQDSYFGKQKLKSYSGAGQYADVLNNLSVTNKNLVDFASTNSVTLNQAELDGLKKILISQYQYGNAFYKYWDEGNSSVFYDQNKGYKNNQKKYQAVDLDLNFSTWASESVYTTASRVVMGNLFKTLSSSSYWGGGGFGPGPETTKKAVVLNSWLSPFQNYYDMILHSGKANYDVEYIQATRTLLEVANRYLPRVVIPEDGATPYFVFDNTPPPAVANYFIWFGISLIMIGLGYWLFSRRKVRNIVEV